MFFFALFMFTCIELDDNDDDDDDDDDDIVVAYK